MTMRFKEDDTNLLLPSFRVVVEAIRHRLLGLRYRPCVRDTLRTQAEADRYAKLGVGIANSIHMYGCAADIICDEHGWDCFDEGCDFYVALVREAKALGCTCGGDWPKRDWPHIQAIPVGQQAAMRRLGTGAESLPARDELARRALRRARSPKS